MNITMIDTLRSVSGEKSSRSRIVNLSISLFNGNVELAYEWLNKPNDTLKGATPMEHIHTEKGMSEVEHLIGRIEHGVYS
jgi:putative toxin-antitoxin system antitoxin component (TIGR02293 family)